jgi:hypothetical protein
VEEYLRQHKQKRLYEQALYRNGTAQNHAAEAANGAGFIRSAYFFVGVE